MFYNGTELNLYNKKTAKWQVNQSFLLLITAAGWFIRYQFAPTEVETIALLLTFIASALLMSLHIGAYCYYRLQGVKHPTQDKHTPK